MKADDGTGNDAHGALIWTTDQVAVGDSIEVDLVDEHDQHERVWLDVDKRVHTPEGEVELWVTMEGYDLDQLAKAVKAVGEQIVAR